MAKPVEVDDKSFKQVVIKAKRPVLVDFWAPSCKPCLAITPTLEKLAKEYDGKIDFAKVNVDQNPQTASGYSIMSIPTLLLFKDGKPIKQLVGLKSEGEIRKVLNSSLGRDV